jgi:SPP1 family predicted phage head-tail adaptor
MMTRDELAGALRYRLRLQRRVDDQGEGGGASNNWEDVAVLWGDIMPSRPGRSGIGNRNITTQDFEIRIRYRADVQSGMRFLWRGDIFMVNTVFDMDNQRVLLAVNCTKSPVFV